MFLMALRFVDRSPPVHEGPRRDATHSAGEPPALRQNRDDARERRRPAPADAAPSRGAALAILPKG